MFSSGQETNFNQQLEIIFRQESGRVLAALIGQLRDFELAQDVLQEAFLTAFERWQQAGKLPDNPATWLLTAARNRAIDRLRRANNLAKKQVQLQPEVDYYPTPHSGTSWSPSSRSLHQWYWRGSG